MAADVLTDLQVHARCRAAGQTRPAAHQSRSHIEPSCGTCRQEEPPQPARPGGVLGSLAHACSLAAQAGPEHPATGKASALLCFAALLSGRCTSRTRSRARMWSSVSSVGDSPPCKQKICASARRESSLQSMGLQGRCGLQGSATHLVVYQGRERQVIEQVREALPDVGVAVLAQALVVEAVAAGAALQSDGRQQQEQQAAGGCPAARALARRLLAGAQAHWGTGQLPSRPDEAASSGQLHLKARHEGLTLA